MSKHPLLALTGAQLLWARFRTDPEVVRTILPHPLRVPSKPLATAFVANFPRTNFGPPDQEAVLSLDAAFKGEVGHYMAGVLLTDDMAVAMGRAGGYPKKQADVDLTVHEDRAVGRATRRGMEVLRLEGDLLEDTGSRTPLAEPVIGLDGEPTVNGVNCCSSRRSAKVCTPSSGVRS